MKSSLIPRWLRLGILLFCIRLGVFYLALFGYVPMTLALLAIPEIIIYAYRPLEQATSKLDPDLYLMQVLVLITSMLSAVVTCHVQDARQSKS